MQYVPMKDVQSELTRHGVPHVIQKFYQENPFPYYDLRDYPTFDNLKHRSSGYVRLLDQSLDSHATLLEVGCGTGQLSNYLAHIPTRRVIGVDFCRVSLEFGTKLRDQLDFQNLDFLQADLFDLPFAEEYFDFVICHGVLHHTPEPRRGLRLLAQLLKPGGGLVVGLYHRLGRRKLWRKAQELQEVRGMDHETPPSLYYRQATEVENPKTVLNWYINMYLQPYESGHLLAETVGWFKENGLIVTGSAPAFEWGASFWSDRPFFETDGLSKWHRNKLTYLFNDLRWWVKPVENGYFLLFGQKE